MADFGALFRADDGSLLVTSDTPTYEFVQELDPASRSGNVSVYNVTTTAYPLVFVNCGRENSGSVLAIEGFAGAWTVTVLSNVSCKIEVFVPLTSASESGVGMVIYDANGKPVFDTNKKILNARAIGTLYESGAALASPVGTNMVAYTGGPVRPAKTESSEWVLMESWAYADTQYLCSYENQYVCTTSDVCNIVWQQVCTPQFTCGLDYMGNFSCYYVDSCSLQPVTVCSPQQSCSYQLVQVCGFQTIMNYADIYAQVKTTSWTIDRAVAKISSDSSVSFDWLLHQSGYYKEITNYATYGYSFSLNGSSLPPSYIPSPVFITNTETYNGILTKDNKYPYTSDRANTGALTCITGVRSDYD